MKHYLVKAKLVVGEVFVVLLAYLSFYKILFHFQALLWESILLVLPPPHLQRLPFCNVIARRLHNIRPPYQPPLCMSSTIHYWGWQYCVKANVGLYTILLLSILYGV